MIHLIGDRLDTGDQLALRGVFSKTFSNKQGLNVTPEVFLKDPRLAQLRDPVRDRRRLDRLGLRPDPPARLPDGRLRGECPGGAADAVE